MEELKCKCCGAPLEKDGHCSYCGAVYKIDRLFNGDPLYVQTCPAQIRRLTANVRISGTAISHLGEEGLGKYAQQEIQMQIAKSLGSMIKYRRSDDYINDEVMIRGEIRVVEPDFRF